jgi:hypothetical protein
VLLTAAAVPLQMQYAAVSFVEVERVVFKAKIGIEFSEISRNDWFDAYTVLPDSSEVYVVPDCNTDARFKDKPYVKGASQDPFLRWCRHYR